MPFEVDMHEIGDFGQRLNRALLGSPEKAAAASQKIASEAVSSAQSFASTRQAARAASALRSARSGMGAEITADSIRWFVGAELGALKYHQFQSWRGTFPSDPLTGSAGYFLFPAIRANRQKYLKDFGDTFVKGLNPPFH